MAQDDILRCSIGFTIRWGFYNIGGKLTLPHPNRCVVLCEILRHIKICVKIFMAQDDIVWVFYSLFYKVGFFITLDDALWVGDRLIKRIKFL